MWNSSSEPSFMQFLMFVVACVTAPPIPRGVCPGVWNDDGGLRPTGSVEEKRAEETRSAVLVTIQWTVVK